MCTDISDDYRSKKISSIKRVKKSKISYYDCVRRYCQFLYENTSSAYWYRLKGWVILRNDIINYVPSQQTRGSAMKGNS
jgi:hypothetical protein